MWTGRLDEPAAAQQVQRWGLVPMEWLEQLEAKHIFSHVEWHMRGYVLRVRGQDTAQLRWTDRNGLETERAVPAAFAKFRAAAQNALPRQEEGDVKLYLLRHGRTLWNEEGRASGAARMSH